MADMSHKQIVNRMRDIADELERLDGKEDLTREDETYWAELTAEYADLDEDRKALEREQDLQRVKQASLKPQNRANGSGPDADAEQEEERTESTRGFKNPWAVDEIRAGLSGEARAHEFRSRALSAVEKMRATDDGRREVMTNIIERYDTRDAKLSALALASSSEDYLRAFGKVVGNQGRMDALTDVERQAVQRSITVSPDSAGGYLVPFQLDPSVILTADGSFNQVRQVARVVQATGDTWHGVSSAGVSSAWKAEEAEADDDAPTFSQPEVDIHKLTIFVPISLEASQDAQNIAQEVGEMIAFEKDSEESSKFIDGDGSGEPQGIVDELSGGSSSIDTDTAATFAVEDVYELDGDLPARYRQRASYLAHRRTYNEIRQFDTDGGSALWVQLGADVPPQLLGRPAYEAEAMDSGTASGDEIMVFGDFSNYVIADRVGTTVEYIPHLFGSNGRPTGQRGWYAYARVGADVVNAGAFRLLTVAT